MLHRLIRLVASGRDQISRSGGSWEKVLIITSTSPVQAKGSVKKNKKNLCVFPLASVVMAYRKVCDAQAGPLVAEALHCSAGLDLDWDLDKEEPQEAAASMERVQMQHVVERQRSGEDFLLAARGRSRSLPQTQVSVSLSSQWRMDYISKLASVLFITGGHFQHFIQSF